MLPSSETPKSAKLDVIHPSLSLPGVDGLIVIITGSAIAISFASFSNSIFFLSYSDTLEFISSIWLFTSSLKTQESVIDFLISFNS